MKKILALILSLVTVLAFAGCGKSEKKFTIAVPNDTTNEARALLLLQANGLLKLKDGAGITATIQDIAENPYNITFQEVEAAQIPNILKDVDYAVINSNYALDAGINPVKQSLIIEGSYSAYANILAVREGKGALDEHNPAGLFVGGVLARLGRVLHLAVFEQFELIEHLVKRELLIRVELQRS